MTRSSKPCLLKMCEPLSSCSYEDPASVLMFLPMLLTFKACISLENMQFCLWSLAGVNNLTIFPLVYFSLLLHMYWSPFPHYPFLGNAIKLNKELLFFVIILWYTASTLYTTKSLAWFCQKYQLSLLESSRTPRTYVLWRTEENTDFWCKCSKLHLIQYFKQHPHASCLAFSGKI